MTDDNRFAELQGEATIEGEGRLTFPDFEPEDETYPWESLPQTIRGAVIEICKNDKLPVPIAAQAALSAVSLACQDLIWVDRGIGSDEKSVCSLFLLTIADSGSRKSRADRIVVKPIEAYDSVKRKEFADEDAVAASRLSEQQRRIREYEKVAGQLLRRSKTLESSGKESAEELARKAEEQLAAVERELADLRMQVVEFRAPHLRRVLYSKISIRQLEQNLALNWPAAGLFSDEAAGILNSKGESDMSSLDRLWDGGAIDVVGRTSRETFHVPDPRLTLSLMVQPIVFDRFLERKGELATGIGLMARVLLSRPDTPYGKRKFQWPESRSTVWIDKFNKRVEELLSHSHADIDERKHNRETLSFEPDAQKHWVEIFDSVEGGMAERGIFENEREFANRYAEHVARLSALFYFFENGEINNIKDGANRESVRMAIPKSTVEAADRVAAWYMNEFKRVFNREVRMREMAAYVMKKLKSTLELRNGGILTRPSSGAVNCRVPLQILRGNCSRYGLKDNTAKFRAVLDWLVAKENISIRKAVKKIEGANLYGLGPEPESVEIKYVTRGNNYKFSFDL